MRLKITLFLAGFLQLGTVHSQWTKTSFDGGNVHSIVPSGSGVIVASDSGLFRSTDNGATWNLIPLNVSGVPSTALKWFKTVHIDGSIIIAGTQFGYFYRSVDNGQTWTYTLLSGSIKSLISMRNNYFAGLNSGIYKSTDNGATWTLSLSNPNNYDYDFIIDGTSVVAGVNSEGIFVSADSGATWTLRNNGLSNMFGNYYPVTALCKTQSAIFACTEFEMYKSTNNATSWIMTMNGMTPSMNPVLMSLATDGYNVFSGSLKLYLMQMGSNQWVNVGTGLPANYLARALGLNSMKLFAGLSNNGLWSRNLSEMLGTTGIGSSPIPQQASIFPNPSAGSFYISDLPAGCTDIRIFNSLGKLVKTINPGKAGRIEVDIKGEPAGIYFVRAQSPEAVWTGKLSLGE